MKRFSFSALLIVTLATFLSSCSKWTPVTSNNGSGAGEVAVDNGSAGGEVAVDPNSPLFGSYWRYDGGDVREGVTQHYLISINSESKLVFVCSFEKSFDEIRNESNELQKESSYKAEFKYFADHLEFDHNKKSYIIKYNFSAQSKEPSAPSEEAVQWNFNDKQEFKGLPYQEIDTISGNLMELCQTEINNGAVKNSVENDDK